VRFPCERREIAGTAEGLYRQDLGTDLVGERGEKLTHAIRRQMRDDLGRMALAGGTGPG